MKKYDKMLTMYRVACYYYKENLSQSEIAKIEGTSRSQISHLLIEARNLGIVEINVKMPDISSVNELEERLCELLGIDKVYITDTKITEETEDNKDTLFRDVASSAATLVPELVKDARIIGIGRGRAVYNTSLLLPMSDESPERIFVPLVGNAGHHYSPLQTSAIVNRFATQFRADGFYINSSVVDTKSMSVLQREELNELSRYWDNLDAAIIGLGDKDETASIYDDNDIPLEFIDKEAFSSAKGEIFGQPFNEDGEIAWNQTQVNRYTYVGIPLQKLKEIPNVICLACGQKKIQPLITAAKLGYYKTLIIDKLTAEKMLTAGNE